MSRIVLRASGLKKRYGHVTAIDGADFELRDDEVLAVVGDNGAGKSSLIKAITGAITPEEGEIFLNGERVNFKSPLDARMAGIETVYQELAVAPELDIATNLFLGRELRKKGIAGALFRNLDKVRMRSEAAQHMADLGIRVQAITQRVETLSGGQRQAVAVARAAAWAKNVVIMDEPTAALGVRETRQVLDLILRVKERGLPVVLISHSMPEIFEVADRIHIHRLGRREAVVDPKVTSMQDVVAVMTGALSGTQVASAMAIQPRLIAERADLEPISYRTISLTIKGENLVSILSKFSLAGKVAVVTGGNRGIGRGIADGFAEAGAQVVIAARDLAKSASAVSEITAAGGKAIAIEADVSDRDSLQDLHDQVISRFGTVDVLVNNAGIGFHADALELDDSEWRRLFDTNLDGVWKASQIFGRTMTAKGSGSIINIGSMSGLIVNRPQWHSPYGISKAAVHHLTRSLAAEWATKGVRVNAIAPGYVKTEIASTEYEDYRHYWRDEVPMQRYGSVEEIAPTALYLATEASSFMTGSVIVIDGGYTLW